MAACFNSSPIEHFPFLQYLLDEKALKGKPLKFSRGVDKWGYRRHAIAVPQKSFELHPPFDRTLVGILDNEEIKIALPIGMTIGIGTEENNLLGVYSVMIFSRIFSIIRRALFISMFHLLSPDRALVHSICQREGVVKSINLHSVIPPLQNRPTELPKRWCPLGVRNKRGETHGKCKGSGGTRQVGRGSL